MDMPPRGAPPVLFIKPASATAARPSGFSEHSTILIGKRDFADVKLSEQYVSVHHAQIDVINAGVAWIKDLNSSFGTFVNGVRIALEKVKLHHGDVITCGATQSPERMIVTFVGVDAPSDFTPPRQKHHRRQEDAPRRQDAHAQQQRFERDLAQAAARPPPAQSPPTPRVAQRPRPMRRQASNSDIGDGLVMPRAPDLDREPPRNTPNHRPALDVVADMAAAQLNLGTKKLLLYNFSDRCVHVLISHDPYTQRLKKRNDKFNAKLKLDGIPGGEVGRQDEWEQAGDERVQHVTLVPGQREQPSTVNVESDYSFVSVFYMHPDRCWRAAVLDRKWHFSQGFNVLQRHVDESRESPHLRYKELPGVRQQL